MMTDDEPMVPYVDFLREQSRADAAEVREHFLAVTLGAIVAVAFIVYCWWLL